MEAQAYVQARMPATRAAIDRVLKEIPEAVSIASVLDIGAGPGTVSLACHHRWPEIEQFTLVENDPFMQGLQTEILKDLPYINLPLDARHTDIPPHDLVICAYMLNELPLMDQLSLVDKLWACALQYMLIIVPGTPRFYEDLMILRSHLINQEASILAPCPHANACPLQERVGEWCHFSTRLQRTREHKAIKQAGLGYEDEPYSYLIFSKLDKTARGSRLLHDPIQHRGHSKAVVCSPAGYVELTATASKTPDLYRKLKKSAWGDLL